MTNASQSHLRKRCASSGRGMLEVCRREDHDRYFSDDRVVVSCIGAAHRAEVARHTRSGKLSERLFGRRTKVLGAEAIADAHGVRTV